MRKVLFFAFLFVSFSASAQWTIINGKQRFAKGLGIPVSDTVATLLNDSAQIVLRPQDSIVYYKFHGKWMKLKGTGGTGVGTLQDVTDNGATTNHDISVNTISLYDPLGSDYLAKISGFSDGGFAFIDKNGDTTFNFTSVSSGERYFKYGQVGNASGSAKFLVDNDDRTYILPAQSGTIALTSDISYPDTGTIATHHYVDSSIIASATPSLQAVTTVGNKTNQGLEVTYQDAPNDTGFIQIGVGISPAVEEGNTAPHVLLYDSITQNYFEAYSRYGEINVKTTGQVDAGSFYTNGKIKSAINSTNETEMSGDTLNFGKLGALWKYVQLLPIYKDSVTKKVYLPSTTSATNSDTLATLRELRNNGGGTTIDTANKWVNSVTKLGDSTIQVVKGTTTTNISFTTATNATRLITKVWNKSGALIPRGAVVYIDGAHSSTLPSIALAKANAESTSAYTYGLVVDSIADNSEGTVIQSGSITNLNLPTGSGYADGQTLYLSPTVAGGFTTTKPLAPNHYVAIGTIVRAHPVYGTIEVAIRNSFQLDEMSDVKIAAVPNDSTLLQFSRADSLWHDVSITNAIGSNYIKPSDTTAMLSKYLRKNDTATLSARIDTKIGIGDTSVFQRKSIGAYTFMANNTNASASVTTQSFHDSSGTYSGTPTFTGTTAPSGTTNHTYRWVQVGKQVTVWVNLVYATAGSAITACTIPFPNTLPTPTSPTGISGANAILCTGSGSIQVDGTTIPSGSTFISAIQINSSNNGYNVYVFRSSGSSINAKNIYATIQYYAQ